MNVEAAPMHADGHGKLADNIVYFCRVLRGAGMRVGPASVNDAIEAVMVTGLGNRDDFYWTLHAVLVQRREDAVVFDEAFRLFWRSRELVEKLLAMFSPQVAPNRPKKKRAGENRVTDALFEGHRNQSKELPPEIEVDARMSVSTKEVLRSKDFAHMNASDLAQARRAIKAMRLNQQQLPMRRFQQSTKRRSIDMRATIKSAARPGGEMMLPRFKQPKMRPPPLVVLADISGSMSQYSRLFLQFVHAVTEGRRDVHAFVFGTRLTNITRHMRGRDIDVALDECAALVEDWSGGTRIGQTLGVFNKQWSRRVLTSATTVLLISDGLERDDVAELNAEMERLQKSCRKLVWLNPLMRYDAFEPRARGVRTMLAHVDEFRPVHSLASMDALCAALDGRSQAVLKTPRAWLRDQSKVAA
ncbi:MAG: VWA domain-containing protein [Ahrensia sp.]